MHSVGAALFNVRVALAARGWGVRVDRLLRPDDPDLPAVVHATEGPPDSHLAEYDPVIPHRRTNRRPLASDTVPDDVLTELAYHAAADGALLVPVVCDEAGALRRFVNVYVDGDDVRYTGGLGAPGADGAVVQVLPSVAGG